MERSHRDYYDYIHNKSVLLVGEGPEDIEVEAAREFGVVVWCNQRWSNWLNYPCHVLYWRGHAEHDAVSWLSACKAEWVVTEAYSSTFCQTRNACCSLSKNLVRIMPENPYVESPCMGVLALHHLLQCHPRRIAIVGMDLSTINKEHEPERCREYIDNCIAWHPHCVSRWISSDCD